MGNINHLSKIIPNAANLTHKLRPLLREENEKKIEKCKVTCKKFEWGEEHSIIFEEIKAAVQTVARIAQFHYYDPKRILG